MFGVQNNHFLCLALIVFIVAMILLVTQKGLATFFVNKVESGQFLFSGDWSPSE